MVGLMRVCRACRFLALLDHGRLIFPWTLLAGVATAAVGSLFDVPADFAFFAGQASCSLILGLKVYKAQQPAEHERDAVCRTATE